MDNNIYARQLFPDAWIGHSLHKNGNITQQIKYSLEITKRIYTGKSTQQNIMRIALNTQTRALKLNLDKQQQCQTIQKMYV